VPAPDFASPEWFAALVGARPEAGVEQEPGPSGTVQVVVTGASDGDATLTLADGALARVAPGADATAAVTLTFTRADADAVVAGELDPSVAFMRGRMKTAGDPGLVLQVLAHARRRGQSG